MLSETKARSIEQSLKAVPGVLDVDIAEITTVKVRVRTLNNKDTRHQIFEVERSLYEKYPNTNFDFQIEF